MPIQIPFLPLNVPPYLLGLDPTLYFDRSHLSKYILQLARYKLYEIRLDTLKKRRYAPAEPSRAEPSRAEPSRAEPTIIVAFPFAIVKSSFHNF